MRLNTTDGVYSVEVYEESGLCRVKFRKKNDNCASFQFSADDSDQLRVLARELMYAAESMDERASFDQFTNEQLLWYVCCCKVFDESFDKVEMVRYMMESTYPPTLDRDELVEEALAFNDCPANAVVRIRASIDDPLAVGWPPCPSDKR